MSIADDYVASLKPWLTADLETYARIIASMAEEVETYAFDSEDGEYEGWERLFDPDLAPAVALPYLAQLVGENLPVGIDEAAARQWIKDKPSSRAGTLAAIVAAAQNTLTGNKTVAVREQDSDTDHIALRTLAAETPSTALLLRDVLSVMPADIVLNYSVFVGATLGDVQAGFATLGAIVTAGETLGSLETDLTGYSIYTGA